jgi:hypothetical protein
MKLFIGHKQRRIGSPNFGAIFFKEPQKKKVNNNYKKQVPLYRKFPQIKLTLKKTIALRASKL